MGPSIVLMRAAAREPGALDQWLASTYAEGYARLGGDEEALLRTYQIMLDHPHEVTPKVEFWSWFDRIVGPSETRVRAEDAPPEVLQRLTHALSGLRDQASRPKGGGLSLSRGLVNGWMLAYSVTFAACFLLLPQLMVILFISPADGGIPFWARLFFSAILAVPAAAAMMACLVPVFGRWRQGVTSSRFPAVSALIGVILGAWLVLSLSALAIAKVGWQHPSKISHFTAQVFDGLPSVWMLAFAFAIVGYLVGLRTRELWQRQRWVNFTADGLGYRGLTLLSLLPCLWVAYLAGGLILSGSHLDPGLVEKYGREKASQSSNVLLSDLPESYQSVLIADQWSADQQRRYEEILGIRQAWFGEMDRLSQRPKFWEDPDAIAMARFADVAQFAEFADPKFIEAGEIEAGLWRGMILAGEDEKFREVRIRLGRMAKVREGLWTRWLSIALLRSDLNEGVGLESPAVTRMFVAQWRRLESMTDNDEVFQAMSIRRSLNKAWENLQSALPGTPVPRPRTIKERVALLSEAASLTAGDPDGFVSLDNVTLLEEDRRRHLAVATIVLEARRLKAVGQPIPSEWAGFRPEVARLGQTYAEWLKLVHSPEGVSLSSFDSGGNPEDHYEVGSP